MKKYLSITLLLLFAISSFAQEADKFFKPLKYRNIGPFRGGRSNTSSGVINDLPSSMLTRG